MVHRCTQSWQIDGETVGTVSDFIFGGSKITAMVIAAMKLKDAYSLEEKLWLLLWTGLAAPPPGFERPRPRSSERAGHARSEDLWANGAGAAGGAATGSRV